MQQKIQNSLGYSLFEKVTTSILDSLVAPRGCAAAETYKQQIAWACEVTHRLSAVDCIPRRRALVFGTQYIQQHLSAWIQQQGGWVSDLEITSHRLMYCIQIRFNFFICLKKTETNLTRGVGSDSSGKKCWGKEPIHFSCLLQVFHKL